MTEPFSHILISSGESSGDLYAAELVRHLRADEPGLSFFGLGGDALAAQQTRLCAHVRDLAVVGLTEVVRHLGRLRRIFKDLLAEVDRRRPDLAVLLDYPDFNLRLAAQLHRRGIPIVYYVSPQLWAWRAGRMRVIRRTVSRMLVLFPFEEPLYRKAGVPVTFVGHPLVELVRPEPDRARFLRGVGLDPARPTLAVLPGSRPGEILHHGERLARALRIVRARRPDVQPVLALAASLSEDKHHAALAPFMTDDLRVRIIKGHTREVASTAEAAIVASGTATVETALLGTPMVVVYRLSPLTYALGRPFVRVSRFAMVNLIAGRELVPELIQTDFTPARVARETLALLDNPDRRERMRADLAEVRARLGEPGASARAAQAVREELNRHREGMGKKKPYAGDGQG